MASAFGGQRSIQLSYGCLGRALLIPDLLRPGNHRGPAPQAPCDCPKLLVWMSLQYRLTGAR